jgi:hypothetical protein
MKHFGKPFDSGRVLKSVGIAPNTMPDFYLVHYEFKDKDGRRISGFYELDDDEAFSRSQIITDILSGQFENVDYVIRCSMTQPSADISEEIADDILAICIQDGMPIPRSLTDFIEEHVGCSAFNEAMNKYSFLDHENYPS